MKEVKLGIAFKIIDILGAILLPFVGCYFQIRTREILNFEDVFVQVLFIIGIWQVISFFINIGVNKKFKKYKLRNTYVITILIYCIIFFIVPMKFSLFFLAPAIAIYYLVILIYELCHLLIIRGQNQTTL